MNATLPMVNQPGVNAKKKKKKKKEEEEEAMILIVWPACMLSIGILTLDLEENTL